MRFRFGPDLRESIAENLAGFSPRSIEDATLRQAAVALVVVEETDGEQACLLLTLRPRTIKRHSGQYALPGGRLDQGETSEEAALRELDEELGLTLAPAQVLGHLDDYPTRSGFRITPVVAWAVAATALRPDPGEVAKVFRIPLEELVRPEIPHLDPVSDADRPVLSALIPTLGGHVYAPTAAILYQFREVALEGRPTRVAHFDQPRFAWR